MPNGGARGAKSTPRWVQIEPHGRPERQKRELRVNKSRPDNDRSAKTGKREKTSAVDARAGFSRYPRGPGEAFSGV